MNKRILAIVVTYYPEKELLEKNVSAFINDVEKILIWENTPHDKKLQYRFLSDPKVDYFGDGVNSISHALNYAWKYAEDNGYKYLLTMDQDSVFEDFSIFLENTIYNVNAPKGIWIPLMVNGNQSLKQDSSVKVKEVFFGITSGMLLELSVIGKVGGWNETFAIDGVDCEFCFHANRVGVNIFCFLNVNMVHQLGEYKKVHLRNRSFELRNYSPQRYYQIYRNHVILMRLFPEQKQFIDTCRYYWGGMIKWIFLFEKQRFRKIFLILKGITEGSLINIDKVRRVCI